jgi:hypothetical protein
MGPYFASGNAPRYPDLVPSATSREEFARIIAADAERWGKLIREARITVD